MYVQPKYCIVVVRNLTSNARYSIGKKLRRGDKKLCCKDKKLCCKDMSCVAEIRSCAAKIRSWVVSGEKELCSRIKGAL